MNTAIEPAAAEAIAGRAPVKDIISMSITVENKPIIGFTPAMKEKAIESGISANVMVIPARTSPRILNSHMDLSLFLYRFMFHWTPYMQVVKKLLYLPNLT